MASQDEIAKKMNTAINTMLDQLNVPADAPLRSSIRVVVIADDASKQSPAQAEKETETEKPPSPFDQRQHDADFDR